MNAANYIRTDLACERHRADTTLPGVAYEEEKRGSITISTLHISSKEGAASIGKPCGRYVTIGFSPLWQQNDDDLQKLSTVLADVLLSFALPKKKEENRCVLVAGLGNRHLTADAIGPLCIRDIVATAHLSELEPQIFRSLHCDKIAAIAPGVLAETGIESAHLIACAINASAADLVIAIDALAAQSCDRLATTIQITNTGILPGAGIGNPRAAIDEETLGVPVIAVGVPTVVDTTTLLYDLLTKADMTDNLSDKLRDTLENGRGYFVSPRESDTITAQAARTIAHAINMAFGIESA